MHLAKIIFFCHHLAWKMWKTQFVSIVWKFWSMGFRDLYQISQKYAIGGDYSHKYFGPLCAKMILVHSYLCIMQLSITSILTWFGKFLVQKRKVFSWIFSFEELNTCGWIQRILWNMNLFSNWWVLCKDRDQGLAKDTTLGSY